MNDDVAAARDYHQDTKHSPLSLRFNLHRLDWANKPRAFKEYMDLTSIPLPTDFPRPPMPSLEAMMPSGVGGKLDLRTLAQILYYSAGITKTLRLPNDEKLLFRAAACAGALYPIELYVVSGSLEGLPAGIYHFSPREFHLTRLREGDYRPYLVSVTGEEAVRASPTTIALTAIFWRSAWKYQARSYRYCFWDSGTILANLLATASAASLTSTVVCGFVDEGMNLLLGVDGRTEAALVSVPLGEGTPTGEIPHEPAPLKVKYRRLSREQVEYPEIPALHSASSLTQMEQLGTWKRGLPPKTPDPRGDLLTIVGSETPGESLGTTILRRGSTRRFRITRMSLDELGSILQAAASRLDTDFLQGDAASLVDIYLIANAVDGLPDGGYYYHPERKGLELLKEGAFRRTAGYMCLEQPLAAEASAVVFFLADLNRVLKRFGNRGYRAAQLEAGIRGGRMYLAAYSLGLGATGLTFYDDEVVTFFEPHSKEKDAIFVVALGKAGRVSSGVEPVTLSHEGRPEG